MTGKCKFLTHLENPVEKVCGSDLLILAETPGAIYPRSRGCYRISIKDGHVVRNGVREHDPYVVACPGDFSCNFRKPVRIPSGDYFMLGDNRGQSDDSRFWGPVRKSWIVGKMIRG